MVGYMPVAPVACQVPPFDRLPDILQLIADQARLDERNSVLSHARIAAEGAHTLPQARSRGQPPGTGGPQRRGQRLGRQARELRSGERLLGHGMA